MHHTKEKGDLGLVKVIADIYSKGYKVLLPISEHLPFDLVMYDGNNFYTVQVKYRKIIKKYNKNNIPLDIRSSWSDSNGSHSQVKNKNKIDIYVVYCPDNDRCYYLKSSKIKQTKLISPESNKFKLTSVV